MKVCPTNGLQKTELCSLCVTVVRMVRINYCCLLLFTKYMYKNSSQSFINTNWGVNVKEFYLFLHSIALGTLPHSSLNCLFFTCSISGSFLLLGFTSSKYQFPWGNYFHNLCTYYIQQWYIHTFCPSSLHMCYPAPSPKLAFIRYTYVHTVKLC